MRMFLPLSMMLIAAAASAGGPVTHDDLLQAASHNQAWLMYGRDYSASRFSPLAQIDTENVKLLAPSWIFQTSAPGKFQTTPLVHDGVMYITGAANHAWALDLLTGRRLWDYSKKVPDGLIYCCGMPNRGFAMLGETLYKVNMEATLVALDAKTGRVRWEVPIDDWKKGYTATVAPLIVKNLVIVGIAGAEFGTRDFIDAYDAETGERVWRFWTVPGPGEPGNETWGGDSWKRGGGSTWITGTYDPELNLIYWGTGNPGPDLDGEPRPGDNLYTCSVVALDADTGERKWHFQFTPHDVHDWDAVADPVLVDLEIGGRPVKALIQANRNGYFYVLDRTNGKFLLAKPYTEITWADGIDAKGRPILIANQDPTEEGTKSCPGMGGGHNWQATAYSPRTGLYYFNTSDGCQIYHRSPQVFLEGEFYLAGAMRNIPAEPQTGSVVAVDPRNGEIRWRYRMVSKPTSGLLATAGGLVFSGDAEGYLTAHDARSGKVLWRFQTGGSVQAPPISYQFRGRQYIAVAAGESLITFGLRE